MHCTDILNFLSQADVFVKCSKVNDYFVYSNLNFTNFNNETENNIHQCNIETCCQNFYFKWEIISYITFLLRSQDTNFH